MVSLRRRTQATNPRSDLPRSLAVDSDSELDTVCEECSSGKQPAKLLLCDKCDKGFHLFCLRPILVSVPKGSWFCPSCSQHQIPKCKLSSPKPKSLFLYKTSFSWCNVCKKKMQLSLLFRPNSLTSSGLSGVRPQLLQVKKDCTFSWFCRSLYRC